jgi:Domain of unknown function (DUF3472)
VVLLSISTNRFPMRNKKVRKKRQRGYLRALGVTLKGMVTKSRLFLVKFFTKPYSGEEHVESERFVKGSGIKASLRRIRWIRVAVVLVAFILLVSTTLFKVSGVNPTPKGTYTNWYWSPPTDGFTEMEHGLTIDRVTPNAPYFWSHQFKFKGGDGGYIGLQSNGSRVNGTRGKTAVFSVFGSALSGTSGSCVLEVKGFDGYNTSGTSCRVPYEWQTGRKYTLRVKMVSSDSSGKWWQAWIKDTFTNTETSVAKIKTPASWKGLNDWSVMWTEYFGTPLSTCASLPYAKATFFNPVANGGAYKPRSSVGSNNLSTSGTCNNSSVRSVVNGASQEMGTSPPTTRNLVDTRNASRTVECAFGTFMGRAPDSSGGSFWTNRYISNNYDLRGLARGLLYSSEGQRAFNTWGFDNYIKRLYSTCLYRTAPSADIATWRSKWQGGLAPEDIFVFVVNTSGQQIR